MTERVGGVEFDVEVGVDGAISASKRIVSSNETLENSFKQVDKSADMAGDGMTRAAKRGSKGLGSLRGAAGQLGFQVQDMAVQLQAGTNAMVVLGQQGSQVASIFGPTGAVVGAVLAVAAAVGSALIPALNSADGSLEKLPEGVVKRLDELKKKIEGVDEASLGSLARVEIDKLNKEYEESIAKAERLEKLALETATALNGSAGEATRLANQAEEARKEAEELAITIGKFTEVSLEAREGWTGVSENVSDTNMRLDASKRLMENLGQAVALSEAKLSENTAEATRLQAAFQFGVSTFEQLPEAAQAMVNRLIAVREQQAAMSEEKIAQMKAEKEAEQASGQRISGIEQLRQEFATERELRAQKFLADGELLREALANQELTKAEFNELEKQRVAAHQQWLIDKEKQTADQRVQIEQRAQQSMQDMRRSTLQLAVGLLDQFAGENKAAALASIAITKGMAIAQTIAHTQTASMLAFASQLIPGDPSSPARAAAAAAATQKMGALKVGLIAATGLAQAAGALSGRNSANTFSGGVPAVNTTNGGAGGGQQQQSRSITIGLTGSNFSGDSIRELISQINDELGDGLNLVTQGG